MKGGERNRIEETKREAGMGGRKINGTRENKNMQGRERKTDRERVRDGQNGNHGEIPKL